MAKKPVAGTADDPVRVAVVPAPAPDGGFVAGEALTPGQRAGLDPIDPELDAEQAQDREHRTNMQTDHELENALDPVSGGPSPAVTADAPLTARQVGAPVSDMNGRPALTDSDERLIPQIRDKLRQAKKDDSDKDDNMRGWRTPQELGIPGAVMKRISESGAPLESQTVPNGHFFPESGTRYRLK